MIENSVPEIACRMCFPDAIDYGELVPNYFLVSNHGKWFLTDNNGHSKMFIFEGKPRPDPYAGKSDEEINNSLYEDRIKFDNWIDDCYALQSNPNYPEQTIPMVIDLGVACYRSGWENDNFTDELQPQTKHQDPRIWLYERAANLIARRESEV